MGVNLFVLSLLLGLLPQAAHAQCSLCGEKLVRFHLNVPANCAVRLNDGDQSQTFSATSLPKAAEGYIRINMNSGGAALTSGTAGHLQDIEVKAELTQYPADREVRSSATFSACGVQMPDKSVLHLWHYGPFGAGGGAEECSCTPSTTTPGDPGGWKDESTMEGSGFPTSDEAQAVLDALMANNSNLVRVVGSVTSGDTSSGYNAVRQRYHEPTDPVTIPGSLSPGCPMHDSPGPPDPNTPAPEPPKDQLEDRLVIQVGVSGTGSGGDEEEGGGTIGGGGMSIQPAPPPGSDEDPQLLPMSWVWDMGAFPSGRPVGTLALITDLTEANPLDLSRFSTRAVRSGNLVLTALQGLPAGQEGWQVAPAPVPDAQALEAQIASAESLLQQARADFAGAETAHYFSTIYGSMFEREWWQAQVEVFKTAIAQHEAELAEAYPTLANLPAYAATVLKFQVVRLDAATVEVRRFKGPETTPGVVHRFELATAGGMPAIRHTEIIGAASLVEVAAGTAAATGGRSWRLEDPDGSVRTGTESPWTNNEQITDESTYSDGGAVFVQRVVTRRVKKTWDVEVVEERVYDSDAAGAVPGVTSYAFYEIASQASTYSKLKWRTSSDGSWERYDYLSNGDTRTYRPWKDGPATPDLAVVENCRSTLTSADGSTVTETVAGQVVSTTLSSTSSGLMHPHRLSVPNPPPPEYYGSNLYHSYTQRSTTRVLPGTGGASLSTQAYLNIGTGRTDWTRDESGNVTAYEEFPATLNVSGVDLPVTRRVRLQSLQPWVAGAPATAAPLREVAYTDSNDRLLKTETLAADDSVVSTTTYTYDGTTTRQTQVVQDGHTVYDWQTSTDGDGNRVEIETDAHGGKTRTVTSPDGEMVSRSKLAVDGATALLTTTTSKDGLTETTTTTGGGLTRTSTVTRDAQGRVTQQVDEDGVTTNFEYQDGGRTVIEKDVADNVLKTTRQYLDGQLQSVEGAAVVAEFHDYSVDTDGLITETVRYGTVAGTQNRKRVTNGLGQLVKEIEPPQDGGAAEKITQYFYDEKGRLETTQVTGLAPVKLLYDGLGRAAVQRVLLGGGRHRICQRSADDADYGLRDGCGSALGVQHDSPGHRRQHGARFDHDAEVESGHRAGHGANLHHTRRQRHHAKHGGEPRHSDGDDDHQLQPRHAHGHAHHDQRAGAVGNQPHGHHGDELHLRRPGAPEHGDHAGGRRAENRL